MRLALHVALKDLRAFRLLLLAWGAALALDLVLSTGWAHGLVSVSPVAYDLTRLAFSLLSSLLGAFVVIGAIHADPPVGTTALWLTRPIGRGQLLLAKLLLAAVAIVVPAVEQWVAVALAGAPPGDAARAFAEALFFQALIILPLSTLAAITADTGRYALALVASLVVVPLTHTVVVYALSGMVFPWRPVYAMLAAAWLLLGLALLVLGYQVLTRKTRRSALAAVVSMVLVLVAANAFTVAGPRLGRGATLPPAAQDVGSSLPLTTRPEIRAGIGAEGVVRQPAGDRVSVLADFEVTGLAHDQAASPLSVRATWAFPGGPRVQSRYVRYASGWRPDRGTSLYGGANDAILRPAIERVVGREFLAPAPPKDRRLVAGVGFDRAPLEANANRPATLTLDVELLVLNLRTHGPVPLQARSGLQAGRHHLVVVPARPEDRGAVRLGHLYPTLPLRGAMWHGPEDALAVVLVNGSRGEAALALSSSSRGAFGGGLSHVRNALTSFGLPDTVDDAWLSGADLTVVTMEPQETIRRIVRVENLRFADVPVR